MKTQSHPLEIYEMAKQGKPGCLFCEPHEGMTIHETENFRVLVDTFPIIPGHLMISSKAHFGSAGEITEDFHNELVSLKSTVQNQLNSLFSHTVFYEHGRAGGCYSTNPNGSKCEHFHLHCLPGKMSIQNELKRRFMQIEMHDYREISTLFFENGNYLYFEDYDGRIFFHPTESKPVEPHLLRTMVCRALGSPQLADWSHFDDPYLFLKSYALVENFIDFSNEDIRYDLLG